MIEITEELYIQMSNDNGGFCLYCKEEAYGVEPDARNYECECCGERQVFGIDELLLMGEIQFKEDDPGSPEDCVDYFEGFKDIED